MNYQGPPIAAGSWQIELVPQIEGWVGVVYTDEARPPQALLVLEDEQVMSLDIDPRPLEWLIERGSVRRV